MTDLADLTADHFAPHTGSRYRLSAAAPGGAHGTAGAGDPAVPAEVILLELAEVVSGKPAPGRSRRTFSLVFRGPRGRYLPQNVYRLEHDAMGPLEIFLVPIAPDERGSLYEAVFN